MSIPSWSGISREERFFSCTLFNDLLRDFSPLLKLLRNAINNHEIHIVDVGYEVAFFRDGFRKGIIERFKALEKQTFDLVFFFQDSSMLIFEIKAQQGFNNEQIRNILMAKELIENSQICPIKKVYLGSIFSSNYNPKRLTQSHFDLKITWDEIAKMYIANERIYLRANEIYND